jgi:hypothetical protein
VPPRLAGTLGLGVALFGLRLFKSRMAETQINQLMDPEIKRKHRRHYLLLTWQREERDGYWVGDGDI